MFQKEKYICFCFLAACVGILLAGCAGKNNAKSSADHEEVRLVNYSSDASREFFVAYNELFAEHWEEENSAQMNVEMFHGADTSQAETVISTKKGDVVTLFDECDILQLEQAGLVQEGWKDELKRDSAPCSAVIVFLVRKGNQKNIYDWSDLVREDTDVVMPSPETSGCGRYAFLAAWKYAMDQYYEDEAAARKFMKKMYRQVLVMDTGSRGASNTFVEIGQGDVLVTWESEAYLSIEEYPEDYEIIIPKQTISASLPVAAVDTVAEQNGTAAAAEAYLDYMYSEEAQRLFGECYYRPSDPDILKEFSDRFRLDINTISIEDFGGWEKAYDKFFKKGGIYAKIIS